LGAFDAGLPVAVLFCAFGALNGRKPVLPVPLGVVLIGVDATRADLGDIAGA
jgi:hypothetical protein